MSSVVLSIGSNLGDRLARLQSAVDGLGGSVRALSPVYETAAWGVTDQQDFLNAVVLAQDAGVDAHQWLRRAQDLESANQRVRTRKWGPRTLDVDVVRCVDDAGHEVLSGEELLTLPHPLAHRRAFVLIPWLAADPDAALTVAGRSRPVRDLLGEIAPAERAGVRLTPLVLRAPNRTSR